MTPPKTTLPTLNLALPGLPGPGGSRPTSCLALGTAFFSVADVAPWHDLLDAYVGCGGNVIDSGRIYGDSEEVIGQWLASSPVERDDLLLITKGAHGTGAIPAAEWPGVLHQELDLSLERLGSDYVDLYFLHRDNHEIPVADLLGPLNEELRRGRIRAIGASNWEYRRLREAATCAQKRGWTGFAVVSNNLSLAEPAAAFYPGLVSVEEEGERWHEETGIPLIPWSSQARGYFAGAADVDVESVFGQNMQRVYGTEENTERRRRAGELGERKGGYTATEIALAFLLHKPYPLVPVVGPRSRAELDSCLRATSLELSPAEAEWLALERDTAD